MIDKQMERGFAWRGGHWEVRELPADVVNVLDLDVPQYPRAGDARVDQALNSFLWNGGVVGVMCVEFLGNGFVHN